MALIESYFKYQKEFQEQYGEQTIVFMEVGSFFEIYGRDNKKSECTIIHKVAEMLHLHVSKKNGKHNTSTENPLMAGFPNYVVQKYVRILLRAQFTIVLIEQDSHGIPNPTRKVTRIYSPGTDMDSEETHRSNDLVSLTFEIVPSKLPLSTNLCCGLGIIDVTTGQNRITEFCIPFRRVDQAIIQIDEKLNTICPNEIIWSFVSSQTQQNQCLNLEERINKILSERPCLLHKVTPTLKPILQQLVLESTFTNDSSYDIFEFVGLHRLTHARTSYVQMLEFVNSHNADLLHELQKPTMFTFERQMMLTNTSLQQLQIINPVQQTKNASVHTIINKCSTTFGKRRFLQRLTHPVFDTDILERRYDQISSLRAIWHQLEEYLRNIIDIERAHRKIYTKKIAPSEFTNLFFSYKHILKLIKILNENKNTLFETRTTFSSTSSSLNLKTTIQTFIKEIESQFNLNELAKYNLDNIDRSFFNKGYFQDIDEMESRLQDIHKTLEHWRQQYSNVIDPTKSCVKIVNNDRDGYYLSMTKRRFEVLKERLPSTSIQTIPSLSDWKKTTNKNEIKLKDGPIRELSASIFQLQSQLKTAVTKQYVDRLEYFGQKYIDLFIKTVDYVSDIDIAKSGAKVSIQNAYVRPTPFSMNHLESSKSSWVKYTGLRHPLIEKINDRVPYIPNNVCIGNVNTDAIENSESNNANINQGILLYGVNAAGKSSLMKAVGVNLIMAQAGFFVAADEMTFVPYQSIFTRLTKEDNIHRGQSSFAVEMSELRDILIRADSKSMILGDELCSGTESISALSIISAGINSLYKRQSSFLFATHLHKLSSIDMVNKLDNVHMYHLAVHYDPKTDSLVYNRKLTPGIGSTLYGLEVCKGMDMPPDFIQDAIEVRHSITESSKKSQSQYNASVVIDKCDICKNKADDIHHIQYQENADENGMIGPIHKNRASNLMNVCKECHHSIHNGQLFVRGYISTSHGRKLDFEWKKKDEKQNQTKKFDPGHISWIMNQLQSNISVTTIKTLFHQQFNLSISPSTISKIRNGTY